MINEIITVTADKEAAAVRPDYESEIISIIRSKSSPKAAQNWELSKKSDNSY